MTTAEKLFVTVLVGDTIYHRICQVGDQLSFGASEGCTFSCPELPGEGIRLKLGEKGFELTARSFDVEHREPYAPDPVQIVLSDADPAVYVIVGRYLGFSEQKVVLPDYGRLGIGKSRERNDIILNRRYVSRVHLILRCEDGDVSFEDCGSSYGTFLNGHRQTQGHLASGDVLSIMDIRLHCRDGELLFENVGTSLHLSEAALYDDKAASADPAQAGGVEGQRITVTRAPRLKQQLPGGEIHIDPPPSVGSKPEINWLSTFLPAAITVALAIVVSKLFNNSMMMIYSLPMTLGGIIVSVTNYLRQKKQYAQRVESRREKYAAHLEEKETELCEAAKKQQGAMRLADPETKYCLQIVKEHNTRLWQRRPEDEDFAHARIGGGDMALSVRVTAPLPALTLEEDPLLEKARELGGKYRILPDSPIVCDLSDGKITGVIGTGSECRAFFRNLFVNLCTHHCYTELQIVCVCDSADEQELGWIRTLPHLQDDERRNSYVATTKAEAAALLNSFVEVLKQRRQEVQEDDSYGVRQTFLPHLVFMILQPAFLEKSHPINNYLLHESGLGASLLMSVEHLSQLPRECGTLIELQGAEGQIYRTADAAQKYAFRLDEVPAREYARFGARMARIYIERGREGSGIPASFTFYEMYGADSAAALKPQLRWAQTDVLRTLTAPLGVGEDGKLISLDIHENGHGPHGLVAGTTGSGKSELLQSYILSLAVCYHPYEVSFLLIDFKGGGMANQFASLPHLAGTITNLDGGELERSLASISAELERRQRLFEAACAKDINQYIQAFKQKKVSTPLPHLLIVVDEFAQLKVEHPDFMASLISTSRIGRSLGVHLILATQKPSGQVSDEIWSNTRFQICLKVNSQESRAVIKSPAASGIREPGRAYLRVGLGDQAEIFELFQSGYSGGKTQSGATQLAETVAEIQRSFAALRLPPLPPICTPPLPKLLPYREAQGKRSLAVGVYDDPERQAQPEYKLPIFGKNTLVIGSPRTGKTTLLQTLLRRVAESFTPQEVSVYILDFASRTLRTFEKLPHVGGVVTSAEDVKLGYLMKMIYEEMRLREEHFLRAGVSSYLSYREAGHTDLPYILLMIDNLASLRELYFPEDEGLLSVLQSGPGLGISVIATCYQNAGIGYKLKPSFSNRIALFCSDSGEYSALFESCRKKVPEIPGRCLVELGKKQYFCQLALPFRGEREADRVTEIRDFIALAASRSPLPARPIPSIPERLSAQDVISGYHESMLRPGSVMLGLNYADVSPFVLNLRSLGILGVCGRKSGSPAVLLRHLHGICAGVHPGECAFYIADSIERELEPLEAQPDTVRYDFLPDRAAETVTEVEAALRERYQALADGNRELIERARTLILVLNGTEVFDAVSRSGPALSAFNNIVGRYRSLNVCVILLNVENTSISFNAPEVLKRLKENPRIILFEDLADAKLTEVSYQLVRAFKKPVDAGTGYYINGSSCDKIKFALE